MSPAHHQVLLAGTLVALTMPFALAAILRSIRAQGSRSSVLAPLLWLASILGLLTLASPMCGLPIWITATLFAACIADVVLSMGMYVYFVRKGQSHQLRSEAYSLHHQMLEKGIIGDSIAGIVDDVDVDAPRIAAESRAQLPPRTGGGHGV